MTIRILSLLPVAALAACAAPSGGPAPTRPQPGAAAPAPRPPVDGRVQGSVAYRERMALLPDAVVEAELLDPAGTVLVRQRQVTDGLQVPIRFDLRYRAPAGTPVRLNARIRGGDGRVMFALPHPVAAAPDGFAALMLVRAP